jgi:hypothetical protein
VSTLVRSVEIAAIEEDLADVQRGACGLDRIIVGFGFGLGLPECGERCLLVAPALAAETYLAQDRGALRTGCDGQVRAEFLFCLREIGGAQVEVSESP